MPELGSMWNDLWRYLITSYPLMGWLFFRCFRIMMSIKFCMILSSRECAGLDSKVDPVSKIIYLLEYNTMCS